MTNVLKWRGAAVVVSLMMGGGYLALASHASLTGYLPYKGHLELGGTAVDGTVPMVFTLENQAATQLATFTPASAVTVTAGAFAVVMGPLSADVLANDPLYVRVSVNGTLLNGRQRIYPVPRAGAAAFSVTDFDVPGALTVGGNGTVTGQLTVNSNGNSPLVIATPSGEADIHYRQGANATWQVGTGAAAAPGGASSFYAYNGGYQLAVTGSGDVSTGRNLSVPGTLDIGLERVECNGAAGLVCPCPAGKRILGGGVYCAGNNEHVNAGWAPDLTSWQGWCEDSSGTNTAVKITILCARL